MQGRHKELEAVLERLLENEGVHGGAIVSRDGIPLASRFDRKLGQRAFSILVEGAMVATLVGSAEEALEELEAAPVRRTIVESDTLRLVALGASREMLLVTLSDPSLPLEALEAPIEAALAAVRGQQKTA